MQQAYAYICQLDYDILVGNSKSQGSQFEESANRFGLKGAAILILVKWTIYKHLTFVLLEQNIAH